MRKRLRSTIKWAGTVLTVLLLVVWVGSAWWGWRTRLPIIRGGVNLGNGSIGFHWLEKTSDNPKPEFWSGPVSGTWWFAHYRIMTNRGIYIPIWFFMVFTGVPSACLWYRDRRRAPGLCIKCGYDLRGNASRVCPECGAAAPRELKVES